MTPAGLPPWPAAPVAHGPVVLRPFTDRDVPMAQELSADPYVPHAGFGMVGAMTDAEVLTDLDRALTATEAVVAGIGAARYAPAARRDGKESGPAFPRKRLS